jgi:hypothetical protein
VYLGYSFPSFFALLPSYPHRNLPKNVPIAYLRYVSHHNFFLPKGTVAPVWNGIKEVLLGNVPVVFRTVATSGKII